MRSRLPSLLACMAILFTAGCDAGLGLLDPGPEALGDPAPGVTDIHIRGPRMVRTPGFYEWSASTSGTATDASYEWSVEHLDSGRSVASGTDPVLALSLEEGFQGHLRLRVVVTRGGERMIARAHVRACPQPPDSDRRDWPCEEEM